jgi:hydroxymethylbilane synthase
MRKLVIASRGSDLALWQSRYVAKQLQEFHADLEVEIKVFKTKGDVMLDTPLAKIGGKGLFVKELEEAILRGEADLAVHSLKDLPTALERDLVLAGVTARADRRDALMSEKYASIDMLPRGSVIGTTSLRRRMQLLAKQPDLIVKSLRGNVLSRIEKLKSGLFDAIVLAYAGLERLGLTRSAKHVQPLGADIMLPAMGQGILGLESRNEEWALNLVAPLIDERAMIESSIERDCINTLNGGCQAPIGVSAEMFNDGSIYARGVVGLPNGRDMLNVEVRGDRSAYLALGKELANKLLALGAKEVLIRAEAMNNNEN